MEAVEPLDPGGSTCDPSRYDEFACASVALSPAQGEQDKHL